MPQWEFLDFLAEEADRLPGFTLRMESEAIGLIREGERVVGLRVKSRAGEEEIRAEGLVIAADGRDSRLRDQADLPVRNLGAPKDSPRYAVASPAWPVASGSSSRPAGTTSHS